MESASHVGCCRMGIFVFAAFAIVIGCGIFGKIKTYISFFFTAVKRLRKLYAFPFYFYTHGAYNTVLGIIDVNGVHYPTIVMGIYVIVTHVILFLGELNTPKPFNYSVSSFIINKKTFFFTHS